ncbi:MFS transporter [Aestuariimicrobium kwangyangense]|uniref:MFS transporter n=1 Tax=Aestuariimicrobium kwangyangense TaxID=396389 RepID=UPI00040861F1|nr:MFS transporter [Aestuariimicrobium kwangyangense]
MSTSTLPTPGTVRPRQSALKTLFGTGVGNALEWYDWNVYATFSVYLAAALFSTDNPQSAFLKTLAVFAVGFVARPFGGLVFGWIADKIGRKHSLALAVIFASLGSLLIGLTPSYASWGAWSSALLLVARLIQGLAHGGELPSAQTYLSEQAPAARRGLWASAIYMTGTLDCWSVWVWACCCRRCSPRNRWVTSAGASPSWSVPCWACSPCSSAPAWTSRRCSSQASRTRRR